MLIREEWLDITKGAAILLVVAGHVLRGFTSAGLFSENHMLIQYIDFTLYSFHMPLFFIISGYLYSKSEAVNSINEYKKTFIKKLIRLGIPYFVFSIIQGVIRLMMDGQTNHPFKLSTILSSWYQPFDQFWFLYALLSIFIFLPLVELALRDKRLIFGLLLLLKLFYPLLGIDLPILNMFAGNAIYFYLGSLLLNQDGTLILSPIALGWSIPFYLVFNLLFFNLSLPTSNFVQHVGSIFLAVTGSLSLIFFSKYLLIHLPFCTSRLNQLGLFSFEIYLLHTLPSAAMRIILTKLSVHSFPIHFILGVGLGLAVPIIIALWSKRHPLAEVLFYPGKYIRLKTEVIPKFQTTQ